MNKILMVLCVAFCACGSSCGAATARATGAVVDCTIQNGGQVEELLKVFGGEGRVPDWDAVEGRALVAGRVIGGCALTKFVERWISGALSSMDAARSMAMMSDQVPVFTVADVIRAREVLTRFRGKVGGVVYVVSSGGDL